MELSSVRLNAKAFVAGFAVASDGQDLCFDWWHCAIDQCVFSKGRQWDWQHHQFSVHTLILYGVDLELWALSLQLTCNYQGATSRCHTHTHASGLPIIFMLLSQTAKINRLSNCNENILHQPVCVWERQALLSVPALNATVCKTRSCRKHTKQIPYVYFSYLTLNSFFLFQA